MNVFYVIIIQECIVHYSDDQMFTVLNGEQFIPSSLQMRNRRSIQARLNH